MGLRYFRYECAPTPAGMCSILLLYFPTPSLIHLPSLTCKGRKLKCDEAKPTCGKCIKASRDCVYGDRSIFRSQEIGSTPGRKRRKRDRRGSEPTLIEENRTWVEVPTERKCQPSANYTILTFESLFCSS